jgi:hypothetical protein
VPLSELRLSLRGGHHGALALAHGLCARGRSRRLRIGALLRGQSGARRSLRVRVRTRPAC